MKNLEEIVREYYNEINSLTNTHDLDGDVDDYLRLFNFTTLEEEKEVILILKDIIIKLQRLGKIQDDCYSR